MNHVAKLALEKLLRSAEAASAKEKANRAITVRFTDKSFPTYLSISTHAEKEQCHGDLLLAMRHKAITIEWDDRAGEFGQIKRILLSDPEKLASFLGVVPRWDAVTIAATELSGYLKIFPVLNDVIDGWRRGLKPRGTSLANVNDWIDAARVISYRKMSSALDIPVRRISAHLTFDSKRVENLWDLIDVLLQGDIQLPQRNAEEVFGEIGIIKYPPTILISGDAKVLMQFDGQYQDMTITRPYIGIPPSAIGGFVIRNSPVQLLTVENLTTFHELAATTHLTHCRVLLYTGGMPSPSWKKIYKVLLGALPVGSHVSHWGDIDAGGFRIASHLAQCCSEANKKLSLHMMGNGKCGFSNEDAVRRHLAVYEVAEIEKICHKWGWQPEYNWIANNKVAVEQESLPAIWPGQKIE